MDEEWTIERHLAGRTAEVIALYRPFIEIAERPGPIRFAVAKSAIALKGERRGFAGVVPGDAHLGGFFDLPRRLPDDPRIGRVDPYGRRLFVHHFRVSTLGELDESFAAWLGEAYEVGRGRHLEGPPIR